jgi:hypothetical protein
MSENEIIQQSNQSYFTTIFINRHMSLNSGGRKLCLITIETKDVSNVFLYDQCLAVECFEDLKSHKFNIMFITCIL